MISLAILFVCLALALGAIAISATHNMQLTVVRTFSGGGIGTDNTVTANAFNTTGTLTASTTPNVSKDAAWTQALTAGAYTIDLTALPDPDLGSVTFSGLKVEQVKIKNNGAAEMTFAIGASNGYTGFGAAFSITLPPGGETMILLNDGGVAVDGTHKTIDVAGTLTQTFSIQLTAG